MPLSPALLLVMLPACGALSLGAPTVLSKGTQSWGRWEHTDEQISIHIYLGDEGEKLGDDVNRALCCEVAEGFLCAYQDRSYDAFYDDDSGVWGGEDSAGEKVAGPPLIFGRLAQVVESRYLVWDVEEREGRPALCIVLPKATPQQVRVADCKDAAEQGSDNAIFDETLHMSGEQVLLPLPLTPTLTLALVLTLTLTLATLPTRILTLTLTPTLSNRSFCPGSP